jgi:Cu/Ag efflux pump CusA
VLSSDFAFVGGVLAVFASGGVLSLGSMVGFVTLAVVILGGLLTSMALNLLILPSLALRYGRFEPGSAARQKASLA